MIKQLFFKQFSLASVKVKLLQVLLRITNNSIKHQSFTYTHLMIKQFFFKQFSWASVKVKWFQV